MIAKDVGLVYIAFTLSQTTLLNGLPGFTFATGSYINPANWPLGIAFLDPLLPPIGAVIRH